MTPAEVAAVLAKCTAYDRRTVGRADIAAWHEILERIDLADGLDAVTRHYRATRDWAMPADILTHAKTAKNERLQRQRRQPQPGQLMLESKYSPRARERAQPAYQRTEAERAAARTRIAQAQQKHTACRQPFATPEQALAALGEALSETAEHHESESS